MNNFVFGKYNDNNSIINKIDVRVKLFLMILLMVSVFIIKSFFGYVLLFTFLLILLVIAKFKFKSFYMIIKPMWLMFLFLLIINILTIKEGRVLFNIGSFLIYDKAIIVSAYIVIRIIMILMISSLLTSTSKPTQLTNALEFYLYPLKIFKINIHEIAMMISIALRFIPTILEESIKIMKAQMSRGIDFKYGKLKDKTRAVISLIVPLFISCFQRADELSDAMICRGYEKTGKRTRYNRFKLTYLDLVATVGVILILSFIFLSKGFVL